jgi:hypothetical protein
LTGGAGCGILQGMELVILDSAYKHGISAESIRSCLLNMRLRKQFYYLLEGGMYGI